ncbi:hypothetical protein U3516DRAFT_745809 [Neocallimastix sp. 'constans']
MTKELEEVYSSRTIDTKKIKKIDLMKKSNYIGRTKKWKTDNPEETIKLSILKYLFDKITKIVPKIQNSTERKCILICSDL